MKIVLLPGLHGTEELLKSFINSTPDEHETELISYPVNQALGYTQLASHVYKRLENYRNYIIIAESFSGPIGVLVASSNPSGLQGLVLCSSFVTPILPRFCRFLPWVTWFRIPAPSFFIRRFCIGNNQEDSLLKKIRALTLAANPKVLASRVQAILSVDVRDALQKIQVPILDLRGKQDHLIPKKSADALLQSAPGTVQKTIDAPHFLIQVMPQEAWQVITKFVKDQSLDKSPVNK